ncbi:anion exchange protein 3 isoform X2 [Orussus abietinus]|uniref:anion exchange protein 3 isoform X2 n=1 Tax=Orussus abietinus TaxID=222816 RepID=UPI0006252C77|nr:anion exchange protein 3 isoform X2 [Orussus abietinus]XP_012285899.1 anion exchange protein 3 isoform X2 [Orussus abietinus]XP_012285900.1 anion exchange protein 3 isoform X2 [Orussus abietinus]XP_012285901.1 anion exchange protein 3 isoform X2 [Orussus abietinus]XP_023288390.1 anion exchange protein 3 isoform X2 [Orussus abietinus]XP_023288391.1 anion exchange protein 3 isoform X2 [Orussus abietinus]XP_023288392.1 anion exchange protein 3 isoform X2 [Orussus abietinus]
MDRKKSPAFRRKLSFLGFGKRPSTDGHGAETGPELDEEMEKVFAMDAGEKFDVARLGSPSESAGSDRDRDRGAQPRYGDRDRDLNQHRKRSYPHPHMPLKSLRSRSMRRHLSPEGSSAEAGQDEENGAHGLNRSGSGSGDSRSDATDPVPETQVVVPGDGDAVDDVEPSEYLDEEDATVEEDQPILEETAHVGSGESEAPISERAASGYSESPSKGSPRVQFERIREEEAESNPVVEEPTGTDDRKPRRHHKHDHKRHHYKSRKYSLQEDPQWRKRSGAGLPDGVGLLTRRVSVQPEEASTLQELDIDDLESHRSDDPRGMRRHKASTVQIGRRKEGGIPHDTLKKMYDHSPHEVFVQLDELHGVGEEREWRETARWIKYEEDVEEGADRWGRPHVASLSFHSLLNLRRCLETGVVLLDLEERDLPGLAYRVVEQMVVEELILPEDRPIVMRALLLRHRHVHEHDRGFRFGMKRNYSSYTSLQSIWLEEEEAAREAAENRVTQHNLNHDNKPKIVSSNSALDTNHTTVDMKEELTYTSSNEDLKKGHNDHILKRIPAGAEATVVLVGAVDFLDQPTIAFVRLAEGVYIPSITEITIPVRFVFVLLGPRNADLDYHEIGRSISTLMANTSFHKVAYKANERRELLSAINEFLDDSIVLPPGNWERQALLPFDELKAKSEAIRKRKAKALEEKSKPVLSATIVPGKKALLAGDGEKKPPPDDDPLRRTRRPFGGLINDIKRRYPFYLSDFTDGLSSSCLAAAIFMYFAALCTAITFGGLLSDKTRNTIGISETLVSCSWTGVIMALFATQPLVIIGTTGPLLLFDESLFEFCLANGLEFLTMRVYVGAWMGIIALTVACVEGSVLVRLFTRFTEEIFTGLISILYIVETFIKLYNYFVRNPLLPEYCFGELGFVSENETIVSSTTISTTTTSGPIIARSVRAVDPEQSYQESRNETEQTVFPVSVASMLPVLPSHDGAGLVNQPNTALMCTILCLGTFLGAYYLRIFRNSHYLGRSARRAFGDFGVPISIITFVLVDYLAQVKTEKLLVPEGLSPSVADRSWFVSPGGTDKSIPLWMAFACCVPALLVYILVFMETQISELIIDKKERKLRKGCGYHMDIVVVCLMNVGCGLMGAPWCCAASVRSLTHVSAVTVMSRTHAPGDKPHIVEVKEQRVSALLVAVLVGVSVLMAPLLRRVPMSVLLGVFLYMGISSTNGVQLFDRVKLFFMPVKHHGTATYVRRVQTYKMHIFTLIQILCLAVLWIVKSTKAALALPFFLILMIPLRAQMVRFFTGAELRALDSKEPEHETKEDELDFYEEAPLPG